MNKKLNDIYFADYIPIGLHNIMNDIPSIVHKELLNEALTRYAFDNNINLDDYKAVEVNQNNAYYSPVKVLLFNKHNMKRIIADLNNYWNSNYKDIEEKYNDLLINKETRTQSDVKYINYLNNKVKMKNRLNGYEFDVSFDRARKNLEYKDSLKETFTYLYQNKDK